MYIANQGATHTHTKSSYLLFYCDRQSELNYTAQCIMGILPLFGWILAGFFFFVFGHHYKLHCAENRYQVLNLVLSLSLKKKKKRHRISIWLISFTGPCEIYAARRSCQAINGCSEGGVGSGHTESHTRSSDHSGLNSAVKTHCMKTPLRSDIGE